MIKEFIFNHLHTFIDELFENLDINFQEFKSLIGNSFQYVNRSGLMSTLEVSLGLALYKPFNL